MGSGRPSGDGRHNGRSIERVEEAPGHGADLVEEQQGGCCLIAMHGAGEAEETEVAVDLLRGSVGDPPVVGAVSSESAVVVFRERIAKHESACVGAMGADARHTTLFAANNVGARHRAGALSAS
jgi:hypothetical protein